MKLVKSFKCVQKEIYGNGTEKILSNSEVEIRKELIRPDIFIEDYRIRDLKHYCKVLSVNGYVKYKDEFTFDELLFLADKFDFLTKNNVEYPKCLEVDLVSDIKYNPTVLILIDDDRLKYNYVLIETYRWQFDYQPRSAGEDMLGEDVTYVHGVWENPIIKESITNKIKGFDNE